MLSIRPEKPGEHETVRAINRRAFGGEDEARLVDNLRGAGLVRLSLVAVRDDEMVGHILFSELLIETEEGTLDALALAPVAVVPEHHRKGIGSELVGRGLEACRAAGHRIVIVLGHPDFYPRFGFSPDLAKNLSAPFSGDAFMAAELVPGALDGVAGTVKYPAAFDEA